MRRKLNANLIKKKKMNASELHSRRKPGNRRDCSVKKQSVKVSESAQPSQKTPRKLPRDS